MEWLGFIMSMEQEENYIKRGTYKYEGSFCSGSCGTPVARAGEKILVY